MKVSLHGIEAWCRKERVFLIGTFVLLVLSIMLLAAGGSIPAVVHDSLDLEISRIVVQLKHLGENSLPEFMDGAWNASSSFSPGSLVLYMIFDPLTAFVLNTIFVLYAAYLGCWLCLELFRVRPWISSTVAFAFALLPFYSIFGLSVMGVPFLVYAAMRLLQQERILISSYAITLVYACFSSVATVGFAVLIVLMILIVALLIKHRRKAALLLGIQFALMVAVYLISDLSLIKQVLGLSLAPASHRTEYVLSGDAFSMPAVVSFFLNGQYHAVSNQFWIVVFEIADVLVLAVWLVTHRRDRDELSRYVRIILTALLFALLVCFAIALFHEFYDSEVGARFRAHLPSAIMSFKLDRFYWLYPALWYISFGIAAEALVRICLVRLSKILAMLSILAVSALTIALSAPANIMLQNAEHMLTGRDVPYVTWGQFFAEDTFQEIKADLSKLSGDVDNYRIGSIGLYPSIALYNGFYCLDGYSNYYDLEYKHRFREIITGELESDPRLKSYYDDWGNRAYLFSHELGLNFFVPADSEKHIDDLRLDLAAFRDMGGEYLFSAVPIVDPEQYGLSSVGEYAQEDGCYKVHVYRVV